MRLLVLEQHCCHPRYISRNLERLQYRQTFFSEVGGLRRQFGQIVFGRFQRLSLINQLLTLCLKNLPHDLRPLSRMLLALVEGKKEQLLKPIDGDPTAGDGTCDNRRAL